MTLAQDNAFKIGYKTAYHGGSRAPCLSAEFMALISGPVGSNIEIASAFARGYQAQCDDEAAALLAQD